MSRTARSTVAVATGATLDAPRFVLRQLAPLPFEAHDLHPGEYSLIAETGTAHGDPTRPAGTLLVGDSRLELLPVPDEPPRPGSVDHRGPAASGGSGLVGPPVLLDGTPVEELTEIEHGQVLDLGGRQFVVEDRQAPARPPAASRPVWVSPVVSVGPPPGWGLVITALSAALIVAILVAIVEADLWPLLVLVGLCAAGSFWLRRREVARLDQRRAELAQRRQDRFAADVIDERSVETRRRRRAPYPSQVFSLLGPGRPSGARLVPEPVAVALGDVAWRPDLDRHGALDEDITEALSGLGGLRSVQLTIEPTEVLLGIVGPVDAALGVAGQVVASLAARAHAPRLQVHCSDTDWARDPLISAFRILARHSAGTGEDYEVVIGPVPPPGSWRPVCGLVIADSPDRLAHVPDLLLSIDEDGAAEVTVPATGTTTSRLLPLGASVSEIQRAADALAGPPGAARPGRRSDVAVSHPPDPDDSGIRSPVLIAAPSADLARGQLALIAAELAMASIHPDRPVYFVLDADAAGLAGLQGLSALERPIVTASADRPDTVEQLVQEWQLAIETGRSAALFTSRLGDALLALARVDRLDLADDILEVVRTCTSTLGTPRGFAALAEPEYSNLPRSVMSACPTRVLHRGEQALLVGHRDGRTVRIPRPAVRLFPDDVAPYIRALLDRTASAGGPRFR